MNSKNLLIFLFDMYEFIILVKLKCIIKFIKKYFKFQIIRGM